MFISLIIRAILKASGIAAIALLVASQVGCASGGSANVALTEDRQAAHLAAFDQVWQTIYDNHWDVEMVETEWKAARDEYRPRVIAAETEGEARRATNRLVASLGQSHFGVIPQDLYGRISSADGDAGGDGDTQGTAGARVRLRGGEALVVHVEPGSGAENAGIEPGATLDRVGETDLAEVIAALLEAEEEGTLRADAYFATQIEGLLSGEVGEELQISGRDRDGDAFERGVTLVEARGTSYRFGNLPPIYVITESETIESGIGYFRLGAFFGAPDVMPAWQRFIDAHAEAPGVVIDLRGNPGGIITMSSGMGGFLLEGKGQKLGTMSTRGSQLQIVLNPRRNAYLGPVAVLIDEGSASNSEILSGGLQGLGRARVFGATTAGAVLPARVEKLPTGDGFIYAFADYINVSGDRLEGVGVVPDEPIQESPADFEDSRDPVLDAAIDWIQTQ